MIDVLKISSVIDTLIDTGAVKATRYIEPDRIVRAVRTRYGGKITKGNIEISLTIGKPNYAERKFIKLCQKAGEPFPVKNIQLKFSAIPSKSPAKLKAVRENLRKASKVLKAKNK